MNEMYNSYVDRYEIKSRTGVVMAWIVGTATEEQVRFWMRNTTFRYNPDLKQEQAG